MKKLLNWIKKHINDDDAKLGLENMAKELTFKPERKEIK